MARIQFRPALSFSAALNPEDLHKFFGVFFQTESSKVCAVEVQPLGTKWCITVYAQDADALGILTDSFGNGMLRRWSKVFLYRGAEAA